MLTVHNSQEFKVVFLEIEKLSCHEIYMAEEVFTILTYMTS